MPVGTRAAVKTLDAADIDALGFPLILANTYHLLLRPGPDLIREAGGLHGFTGFNGNFLTDSGGFQVFSLSKLRKVTSEGVVFRSHLDGAMVELSPEVSIDTQLKLGSDILMVMDECLAYPHPPEAAEPSLRITMDWEKRSLKYFNSHGGPESGSFLFGIVQGGFDRELRQRAASLTAELGFDGYAVGGLSVGEPPALMHELLDLVVPELPESKPRYLMGVGSPLEVVRAVAQGIDLFDCVLPTRLARHAVLLTWKGKLKIRNQVYRSDFLPPDPDCSCPVCKRYSRAYLRYLFHAGEFTGMRLATLHNLAFMSSLMKEIRQAIREERLADLIRKIEVAYGAGNSIHSQHDDAI